MGKNKYFAKKLIFFRKSKYFCEKGNIFAKSKYYYEKANIFSEKANIAGEKNLHILGLLYEWGAQISQFAPPALGINLQETMRRQVYQENNEIHQKLTLFSYKSKS